MASLIVPLFCMSVGFVVYLGASGILIYLRGRKSQGIHSTRKERKAATVIGVAAGLVLAMNMVAGSEHNIGIWMGVDSLLLLMVAVWVWRILKTQAARR